MPEEFLELTDQEIESYLSIALANGFSKGTANVSPQDMKKLTPLLKHYAKAPHPFRACVRDNQKRFGPRVNAICAVVKDLIYHSTKWRAKGQEAGMKKAFSEEEEREFVLDAPDDLYLWLSEVTEEQIDELMIALDKLQIEEEDGKVDLEDNTKLVAELFFDDGETTRDGDLIWKTVLREGEWKYSPGRGANPVSKPLTVVKDGASNPKTLTISMSELMENFKNGAVEHVTVPTSHDDRTVENTGFVRDVRMTQDEGGRWTLQAAHDFTEPDIKEKVKRGSIANTSAGIMFDHIAKESGTKYNAVLAHVALTNRPWLNGMKPFGAELSEDNLEVVSLSQETVDNMPDHDEGGEEVPTDTKKDEQVKDPFVESLGLSADEAKAGLARLADLERREREREIEDTVKGWEDAGKAPAVVAKAKAFMLSDQGGKILNLSENGKTSELSATELVREMVDATPNLNLTDDLITEENASKGEKPEEEAGKDEVELSEAVKNEAAHIFLNESVTQEEAIEKAKQKLSTESK